MFSLLRSIVQRITSYFTMRKSFLEKVRQTLPQSVNILRLTVEELDKEVITVLTTGAPETDDNSVEFNYKEKAYRARENQNKAIVLFQQFGNIRKKSLDFDEQETKKNEDTVEELDTKRRNKFNFCDRATQTPTFLHMEKETETVPTPQFVFEGTVSLSEIVTTYQDREISEGKKANEEETTKVTKKNFRKSESNQNPVDKLRFFRICERMIDQNLLSDANIDFSFYDTPADEFKDKGMGSLLALWKFSHQPMKGVPVTSLSWNSQYPDMFAAAFGAYNTVKKGQGGCVCIYSLKSPSYPEKVFPCKTGVHCLEFHKDFSYLLAVGFADGTVAVYDLRKIGNLPEAVNKNSRLEHSDIVSHVRWLPDSIDGQHNFCSISADSKVINWLLAKSELIPAEVINFHQNDAFFGNSGSNRFVSCGTSISFNPCCSDLFLIGTENGLIHKCSNLFTAQYLDSYRDHQNIVYNVQWNPFHPRVFLSCSADWTIRIWDHSLKESVFTFDLLNEVKDVTWAPFSSSLFAAVTNDGKVHIFDIMMNRHQPTATYNLYTSKKNVNLTRVQFNPVKPVIIVGDDKGAIISFKLSPNLRSSLKVFEAMEKSKFASSERDKMEKILKLARNLEK